MCFFNLCLLCGSSPVVILFSWALNIICTGIQYTIHLIKPLTSAYVGVKTGYTLNCSTIKHHGPFCSQLSTALSLTNSLAYEPHKLIYI